MLGKLIIRLDKETFIKIPYLDNPFTYKVLSKSKLIVLFAFIYSNKLLQQSITRSFETNKFYEKRIKTFFELRTISSINNLFSQQLF